MNAEHLFFRYWISFFTSILREALEKLFSCGNINLSTKPFRTYFCHKYYTCEKLLLFNFYSFSVICGISFLVRSFPRWKEVPYIKNWISIKTQNLVFLAYQCLNWKAKSCRNISIIWFISSIESPLIDFKFNKCLLYFLYFFRFIKKWKYFNKNKNKSCFYLFYFFYYNYLYYFFN